MDAVASVASASDSPATSCILAVLAVAYSLVACHRPYHSSRPSEERAAEKICLLTNEREVAYSHGLRYNVWRWWWLLLLRPIHASHARLHRHAVRHRCHRRGAANVIHGRHVMLHLAHWLIDRHSIWRDIRRSLLHDRLRMLLRRLLTLSCIRSLLWWYGRRAAAIRGRHRSLLAYRCWRAHALHWRRYR